MRLKVFICLLLAGITLAIYWPVRNFSFVEYDDPFFILSPNVAAGLSPIGIDWAIKGVVAKNWHPVTTFSFLLMHELFGVNPGAEHLVNILFHAANTVLLFLVLYTMAKAMDEPPPSASPPTSEGKALWGSAIVAAIFAWHPLRVESVAWISERKDVLFVFFMLLSLLCYASYARFSVENSASAPKDTSRTTQRTVPTFYFSLSRKTCYNLALLFFILSLLSKATVVTLPFLLFLLDYWPLQRLNRSTLRSRLAEKAPFFALAILFCALTFWIHKATADVESTGKFAIGDRIENVSLSYVNYLGKFFWPENLAVPYPYSRSFDGLQFLLAALLLLAISAFCILQISRRPYLTVGWLWYLVTMLPVIGLVQIGTQGMADRHTYTSLIGPVMAIVWLVWEWARNDTSRKYLSFSMTVMILIVCVVLTERQLPFWRNTVTLTEHTIAVTPENTLAQQALAVELEQEGFFRQAAVHYRIAIESHPNDKTDYMPNFLLAGLMAKMGYYQEAEARLDAALQIVPNSADAMNNLAWTLAACPDSKVRNGARAVDWAKQACNLTHYRNPTYMTTLAAAYAEAGRFDEAVDMTQKTIALADRFGEDSLSDGNQELLQIYSAHQTYAQTHGPSASHSQ